MRFVVLRHEGVEEPHFDLLFETQGGGALMTWRSPVWPIERNTAVVMLEPHRNVYLEYEGPISGDRGVVHRVAAGLCKLRRLEGDTYLIKFVEPALQSILIWQTEGLEGVAFPAEGGE